MNLESFDKNSWIVNKVFIT